jgi:chromosome segregation ATPase
VSDCASTGLRAHLAAGLLALAAVGTACQTAVIGLKEKLGIPKREQLVARVEEGREAQLEAKQEFQDALAAFKAATGFQGGALEDLYEDLKGRQDSCAESVEAVGERIDAIEGVAEALFDEWSAEIDQYQSIELKSKSKAQLADTERRYQELVSAMRKAEAKMEPVLAAFKDRVLYLKHNLNAMAIASLDKDLVSIEGDVAKLVQEMERSIAEADAFIKSMDGGA